MCVVSVGLSFGLVGCGDPQKEARSSLEKKGYEMTAKDLLVAAAAGDLESIALFREAGAEIDGTDPVGNTALIKAASGGHLKAVETLLGLGADPRRINAVGRDALISASAKGYEDVARMLLHRGADATLKDTEGWGALSIAAYNGHAGVVSLLSATATPAELDDALLVASFSGDVGVINALLGQGANINARSPESKTPLMIAASTGKLDAVRVLLQNQANPFAVDREDKTAANLSQDAGFETVTRLITNPDAWGTSKEGLAAAAEMAQAQEALEGGGVEETLSKKAPAALAPGTPAVDGDSVADKPSGTSLASAPLRATPVRDEVAGSGSAPSVSSDGESETGADSGGDLRAKAAGLVAHSASLPRKADAASPRSTHTRIEAARRLREESKSKPIVALNGSTIHSRTPEVAPVKGMVLAAYHEESLPILVDQVDGTSATVRRLDVTSDSFVAVEEGGMIPGTNYRVEEVTSRFVSSKEGKGRMVDVSRIRIEDTKNGSSHLLVKDVSGQTADTYAILTAPNSQYRYVVKAGDVFRTTQPDVGAVEYQVLDIRPTGVVIKDLATEEVVTVARDGYVAP